MSLFQLASAPNFSDPNELYRYELAPANNVVFNTAITANDLSTTASFTSLNAQGLADTTNWATDTFKSLLSVTEPGELQGYIGPTMATTGDVHTVEFTVDGVVTTRTVTISANTFRPAFLAMGLVYNVSYTTASAAPSLLVSTMSSDRRNLISTGVNNMAIPTWHVVGLTRPPLLAWKSSFSIRVKNSAAITNSTATAYSALIYRLKGG